MYSFIWWQWRQLKRRYFQILLTIRNSSWWNLFRCRNLIRRIIMVMIARTSSVRWRPLVIIDDNLILLFIINNDLRTCLWILLNHLTWISVWWNLLVLYFFFSGFLGNFHLRVCLFVWINYLALAGHLFRIYVIITLGLLWQDFISSCVVTLPSRGLLNWIHLTLWFQMSIARSFSVDFPWCLPFFQWLIYLIVCSIPSSWLFLSTTLLASVWFLKLLLVLL